MYRTIEDWERFLGERIKGLRVRKNISQEEMAARTGLSISTIHRIESGKGVSLGGFLRVLQTLDATRQLETLVPEADFSPIQVRDLGHQRKRSRARANRRKEE